MFSRRRAPDGNARLLRRFDVETGILRGTEIFQQLAKHSTPGLQSAVTAVIDTAELQAENARVSRFESDQGQARSEAITAGEGPVRRDLKLEE